MFASILRRTTFVAIVIKTISTTMRVCEHDPARSGNNTIQAVELFRIIGASKALSNLAGFGLVEPDQSPVINTILKTALHAPSRADS